MNRYIESPEVTRWIKHDAITNPLDVRHFDVPLEVDSDATEGKQEIHLGVAESANPKSLVLFPVGWSDYPERPFQEVRIGAMARFSDSRVVCLGYPGMGYLEGGRGAELTERQIDEAKTGRAKDLAQNYWTALDQTELLLDNKKEPLPVAVFGTSQGSFMATELAAASPDGTVIRDAYFNEPVATSEQSVALIGLKLALMGGRHQKEYIAMNEGAREDGFVPISDIARQFAAQRRSHLLAARTFTGGRQAEVVTDAYENGHLTTDKEHGTRLHVVTAEKGLVRPSDIERFRIHLGWFGHSGNWRVLPREGHNHLDSLPVLGAEMGRLAVSEA